MKNPLFDQSTEYDVMLSQGLALSGEKKDYFMRGRVDDLKKNLGADFRPERILDYGCGLGETSDYLSKLFPEARILGVDTAANAIVHARKTFASQNVSFSPLSEFSSFGKFNLCYSNGVFHHIEPKERRGAVKQIYQSLAPDGRFAFFENNPWNPGTKLIMSRIPFDKDAQTLSHHAARELLQLAGFSCAPTRFLFYFPRFLRFLRFLEPFGATVPLGAQYYVLGIKPFKAAKD